MALEYSHVSRNRSHCGVVLRAILHQNVNLLVQPLNGSTFGFMQRSKTVIPNFLRREILPRDAPFLAVPSAALLPQ